MFALNIVDNVVNYMDDDFHEQWTREEFTRIFGLEIPEDLVKLSYEPDNGIYFFQNKFQENCISDDPPHTIPLMAVAGQVRANVRASLLSRESIKESLQNFYLTDVIENGDIDVWEGI